MVDPGSTAVVITGMHRSGTSFVASALQAAGLSVGDRLLTDFPGNPRGHFEDVDFFTLHEDVLASRPEGSFVTTVDPLRFDDAHRARAAALVAGRSGLAFWAFKDPRTTLFLDEWHALLPRARYVLVYRHPLEVLVSILRRGINRDVLAVPALGLRVWRAYNERLLAFRLAHREHCLLAPIDAVTADVPGFVARVGRELGAALDPTSTGDLFHADELQRLPLGPEVSRVLALLDPEAATLLARLDAVADLQPPAPCETGVARVGVAAAAAELPGAPALACLIAAIAPEVWARVPTALLASLRDLEREQRELGESWNRHKQHIEGQAAHIEQQATYIRALEADRARLAADVERLAAEAERLAAEVERLAAIANEGLVDQVLRRLRSR
jgi:hypothetical protein